MSNCLRWCCLSCSDGNIVSPYKSIHRGRLKALDRLANREAKALLATLEWLLSRGIWLIQRLILNKG